VLKSCFKKNCLEAGLDEAGRGCLAGPVYAAAVILPPDFKDELLRDSKMLTSTQRQKLRLTIEKNAIDYSVQAIDSITIDKLNILKAAIKAMHLSIDKLKIKPQHLLIDGNYFINYKKLPHKTIVKGDNTYMNIAAASILAKTYRDEKMEELHLQFPEYYWNKNKGYGTRLHVEAIRNHGLTPYHRRSFHVKSLQMELFHATQS